MGRAPTGASGVWEGNADHLESEQQQCADLAVILDEGTGRIHSILATPAWRRNSHALTRTEVLDFTGWLPYKSREEFAGYRVEHPELELFPPYNFNAPDQSVDEQAEKGVLPLGLFDSLG